MFKPAMSRAAEAVKAAAKKQKSSAPAAKKSGVATPAAAKSAPPKDMKKVMAAARAGRGGLKGFAKGGAAKKDCK